MTDERRPLLRGALSWGVFVVAGLLVAGAVALLRTEGTPVVFDPPEPRVDGAPPGARVEVPVRVRNVSEQEVTIVGADRG